MSDSFTNSVANARNNLQGSLDMIQNAWIAYTFIITTKTEPGYDPWDTIKAILEKIPVVGDAIDVGKECEKLFKVVEWGERAIALQSAIADSSDTSGASGSVKKYLDGATKKINAKMYAWDQVLEFYNAATSEQQATMRGMLKPIHAMKPVEKDRIRYAAEYHLFKQYVRRNARVFEASNRDRGYTQRHFSVSSGLNETAEAYIYLTFGTAEFFNQKKYLQMVGRHLMHWVKREYLSAAWTAACAKTMDLMPISCPKDLVTYWGASRTHYDHTSLKMMAVNAASRQLSQWQSSLR